VTDSPNDQAAPDTSGAAAEPTTKPARRAGGALGGKVLAELREIASGLGIADAAKLRKGELIDAIKQARGETATSAVQAAPVEAPAAEPKDERGPRTRAGARREPATEQTPTEQQDRRGQDDAPQDQSAPQDQDGSRKRDGQRAQGAPKKQDAQKNQDGPKQGGRGQGQDDAQRSGGPKNQGAKNQNDKNQNDKNQNDKGQNDRGQNDKNQNDRGQNDVDDENGGRRRNRRGRNRGGRGADGEPTYADDDVLVPAAGILDILDNYAFVRTTGYLPSENDVYVSLSMVRKWGLRKGDAVTGQVRQPREGERKEKFNPMVRVDTVNGMPLEDARGRVEFAGLTPVHPDERLRLETDPTLVTTRLVDLFAPIGKGQRSLVVAPPRAGRTTLVRAAAEAVTSNNPECHLMVVLIDERPEEVTQLQRAVKGEVIASTFDRPATDHTIVAELAVERAKRLVELGHDVVVLLDSITRLGRAYHQATPASGRVTAGVDASALHPVKALFGAARNAEDGGSLTVVATALVETGSAVDETVLEELDGAANSTLRLVVDDRGTVFPAVDVIASRTHHDELLLDPQELEIVAGLRRALAGREPREALDAVAERVGATGSNGELLLQLSRTPLA
jgi:transcription termination factor Rho